MAGRGDFGRMERRMRRGIGDAGSGGGEAWREWRR